MPEMALPAMACPIGATTSLSNRDARTNRPCSSSVSSSIAPIGTDPVRASRPWSNCSTGVRARIVFRNAPCAISSSNSPSHDWMRAGVSNTAA